MATRSHRHTAASAISRKHSAAPTPTLPPTPSVHEPEEEQTSYIEAETEAPGGNGEITDYEEFEGEDFEDEGLDFLNQEEGLENEEPQKIDQFAWTIDWEPNYDSEIFADVQIFPEFEDDEAECEGGYGRFCEERSPCCRELLDPRQIYRNLKGQFDPCQSLSIQVTPPALLFLNTKKDALFSQTFKIRNSEACPIRVKLTGPEHADFSIQSKGIDKWGVASIQPGLSFPVKVQYKPSSNVPLKNDVITILAERKGSVRLPIIAVSAPQPVLEIEEFDCLCSIVEKTRLTVLNVKNVGSKGKFWFVSEHEFFSQRLIFPGKRGNTAEGPENENEAQLKGEDEEEEDDDEEEFEVETETGRGRNSREMQVQAIPILGAGEEEEDDFEEGFEEDENAGGDMIRAGKSEGENDNAIRQKKKEKTVPAAVEVISGPFTLDTAGFNLLRNQGTQIQVKFCPNSEGLHERRLALMCDNGEVNWVTVRGRGMGLNEGLIDLQGPQHHSEHPMSVPIDPACSYFLDLGVLLSGESTSISFIARNNTCIPFYFVWSVRPLKSDMSEGFPIDGNHGHVVFQRFEEIHPSMEDLEEGESQEYQFGTATDQQFHTLGHGEEDFTLLGEDETEQFPEEEEELLQQLEMESQAQEEGQEGEQVDTVSASAADLDPKINEEEFQEEYEEMENYFGEIPGEFSGSLPQEEEEDFAQAQDLLPEPVYPPETMDLHVSPAQGLLKGKDAIEVTVTTQAPRAAGLYGCVLSLFLEQIDDISSEAEAVTGFLRELLSSGMNDVPLHIDFLKESALCSGKGGSKVDKTQIDEEEEEAREDEDAEEIEEGNLEEEQEDEEEHAAIASPPLTHHDEMSPNSERRTTKGKRSNQRVKGSHKKGRRSHHNMQSFASEGVRPSADQEQHVRESEASPDQEETAWNLETEEVEFPEEEGEDEDEEEAGFGQSLATFRDQDETRKENLLKPVVEIEIWLRTIPIDLTFNPEKIIVVMDECDVPPKIQRLLEIRNGSAKAVEVQLKNLTHPSGTKVCPCPKKVTIEPESWVELKLNICLSTEPLQSHLEGTVNLIDSPVQTIFYIPFSTVFGTEDEEEEEAEDEDEEEEEEEEEEESVTSIIPVQ